MELNYSLPRIAPKIKGNFYAKCSGYDNFDKFDYASTSVADLNNLNHEEMFAIDISRDGQNGVIHQFF